jgi:hypothetical protein
MRKRSSPMRLFPTAPDGGTDQITREDLRAGYGLTEAGLDDLLRLGFPRPRTQYQRTARATRSWPVWSRAEIQHWQDCAVRVLRSLSSE